MGTRNLTTLLAMVLFIGQAQAGPFFKRTPKPEPAEHVPALIKTLQSDPDDDKREDAAEQLRNYDLKTFPDIIPALIEALKNDRSNAVRLEVVSSISTMRPITQAAGYALEEAVADDASLRVRASAKSTLVEWVLVHGYRQTRNNKNVANETEEPPLAGPSLKTPLNQPPKTEPIRPPVTTTPTPVPATPVSRPSTSKPFFPLFRSKEPKPDEGPALNAPK